METTSQDLSPRDFPTRDLGPRRFGDHTWGCPKSLLLFWDHLHDSTSYILCPPEDDVSDALVQRASLPVRLPPGANLDDLAGLQPLPAQSVFDKPLASAPTSQNHPKDLDPDPLPATSAEDQADSDDDVLVEISHSAYDVLPQDCPFTFLCLSSENKIEDASDIHDLTSSDPLPEVLRKQRVTHIPVTADEVLRSDGEERFRWMAAGRKEIDNLQGTGTVEGISPERKEQVKSKAKSQGRKYIELPSKVAFTIKPDKYKARVVACGTKTSEINGKIFTTDLDAAMLRFLLSWGSSSSSHAIASLDVTAAFLNAALPEGWLLSSDLQLSFTNFNFFHQDMSGLCTKPFTACVGLQASGPSRELKC